MGNQGIMIFSFTQSYPHASLATYNALAQAMHQADDKPLGAASCKQRTYCMILPASTLSPDQHTNAKDTMAFADALALLYDG